VVLVAGVTGPLLYPVSLGVAGRPVLVVGGGRVAARKVAALVACGALVTVVALETAPELDSIAKEGSIVIERRPYRAGEAGLYRLAFAATGAEDVDRQVGHDAETAGVWCNVAGAGEGGTFQVPAVGRVGPVTVAVSTSGASPALAAWLRSRFVADTEPWVAELAALLETARRKVQLDHGDTETVDWTALLDTELPDLVREGRVMEARRLVAEMSAATRPPARAPDCEEGSDGSESLHVRP
jgi:precorrin-2 dehydrogenase / sirohydrochlorin ferrochelatase